MVCGSARAITRLFSRICLEKNSCEGVLTGVGIPLGRVCPKKRV